ncbi:unnamed protein product [Withania somnifera]
MASCTTNNPHQSMFHVFVYGSLLADDIVRALLKRVPPSNPAILHNFHRFSIKGRVYPAILPVENKRVNRKVLLDITVPELNILDAFEDFEYERTTVDVSLMDSSKILQAETYVWVNKRDPDSYGEWNFEKWGPPESKTGVSTYESFYDENKSKP